MVEKRDSMRSSSQGEKIELWNEHPDYYRDLEATNLWPLWEEIHKFTATPEPCSKAVPHLWRYDEARRLVLASADMLTAEEAERRVLALENPGLEGRMTITRAMYAGYQLLMPGEIAPSHRHSPAAFRFIMEGQGAYTAVDGQKTIMNPGDFVVTPSWCWHDHGNETDIPMIWLDGLDWPLVNQLELWFFEPYPEFQHPETDGLAPIRNYTYKSTRAALEEMRTSVDFDACYGLKRRYTTVAGEDTMPTITAYLQLLPKGYSTERYRQTDACVYSVVEGYGRTVVGNVILEWGPQDAFVVPTWAEHRHFVGDEDAVLFSFSDRGVQERLGLWRERRG